MQRHYLDYAATSPLRPEVLKAMLPWMGVANSAGFGNANALYKEGKAARQALESARASFAASIAANPNEIIFCSGGTESDNMAILGIAQAARAKSGKANANHVICSAFEHHAVLKTISQLKSQDFSVTVLKPRPNGFISSHDLANALRPDTILVTVMLVQNELGTVQTLPELVQLCRDYSRQNRRGVPIYFHTDAVQALGKLPLDIKLLGVDAASFSAHKIGGPKGIGALYLRTGTVFAPLQPGGGQESGRRGGTQDVAGAVGFACAANIACDANTLQLEQRRLGKLRDRLATHLLAANPRFSITVPIAAGNLHDHVCNILPFLVRDAQSEMMVLHMDEYGFAVSGGSACSTGSLQPSHVLTSIGIAKNDAFGSLRISLGWASTDDDIAAFAQTIEKAI